MPENNLINLAVQVQAMRIAQKKYFELIGTAKRTKTPADFAAAATVLKQSKQQEKIVDDIVQEFFGKNQMN
jgi:hypothetical protein